MDYKIEDFDKIAIAPISTSHLRNLGWWDKKNTTTYTENRPDGPGPGFRPGGNQGMGGQMIKFFEEKIEEAFKHTPNSRFKLVEYGEIDRKTIVLALAVTEIVPVKKYLIGADLIGDGTLRGGTVAIEGLVKQGKTNKLIAMFQDRRVNTKDIDYVDETKISYYSHAKPIMKEWSKLFVSLANKWEKEHLNK